MNKELLKKAEQVLKNNLQTINGTDYVLPSKGLYPAAWGWDTPMIAVGLHLFNPDKAVSIMQGYLSHQWENGLIPQIVFPKADLETMKDQESYFPPLTVWYHEGDKIIDYHDIDAEKLAKHPAFKMAKGKTTSISQYPVWAICLEKMNSIKAIDREALKDLVYKIEKSHEFFTNERDPLGLGIAAEFHPWIGCDNAPCYDIAMENVYKSVSEEELEILRPQRVDIKKTLASGGDIAVRPTDHDYVSFLYIAHSLARYSRKKMSGENVSIKDLSFAVYTPMLNALLNRADEALAHLAVIVGDRNLARKINQRRKARSKALVEHLWDKEQDKFVCYDAVADKKYISEFIGNYFPVIDSLINADMREKIITDIKELYVDGYDYPLPTTSKANNYAAEGKDNYSPKCYWRGPNWICIDAMLLDSLPDDIANKIKAKSLEAIEREGFFEYFNPETGEGLGTDNFGWTASFATLWAFEK